MAFLLFTSKNLTRSGVRAVTMKQIVLYGGTGGFLLIVGVFALGILLGKAWQKPIAVEVPVALKADPVEERFAVDRLGDMKGRLLTLESDARSLVKRLGALESIEKSLSEFKASKESQMAKPLPKVSSAAGGLSLAPRTCDVASGEPGATRQEQAKATEEAIKCLQDLLGRLEGATSERGLAIMTLPTVTPVSGSTLGSVFGNRIDPINGHIAFHSGLDFPAVPGTPIKAAGGGRVSFAGWVNELGNVVEIDHGNGVLTRYAHTSRIDTKLGEVVSPGQLIAAVGNTGRSTGPHLHFEVIKDGMFVDPIRYLRVAEDIPGV